MSVSGRAAAQLPGLDSGFLGWPVEILLKSCECEQLPHIWPCVSLAFRLLRALERLAALAGLGGQDRERRPTDAHECAERAA